MNIQTSPHVLGDPTNELVEQARRVLPGGSFGNMPAEVIPLASEIDTLLDADAYKASIDE